MYVTRIKAALERFAQHRSYITILLLLAASVGLLVSGLRTANEHYALSQYPPPLFQGQLAFSAELVKGWYATLLEKGTLEVYRQTQYLDFLFIVGLMSTILFTQLLLIKLNPRESRWYTFAVGMSFWGPALATADVWENLVTLVMLSDPTGFPNILAYVGSTFTVWKLGWAFTGTSLVLVQLVSVLIRRLRS